MFREIKSEFIDGLEEQTWMDNATRAQARLKVSDTNGKKVRGLRKEKRECMVTTHSRKCVCVWGGGGAGRWTGGMCPLKCYGIFTRFLGFLISCKTYNFYFSIETLKCCGIRCF